MQATPCGGVRITLSGAFVQSESESISANVTWGKRRAMEAGKASIQYKKLYGYRKGEDGKPVIIPEQAEIIRRIYDHYLGGASLRMRLQNFLDMNTSQLQKFMQKLTLKWRQKH